MLRVVADTNIYISALNFGGAPLKLLKLAEAGDIRLVSSEAILDETERVLREKFGWAGERIAPTFEGLRSVTERVEPTHRLDIIAADPSDNRILECAEAGRADYIVSGDKHLLRLKQHGNAPVLKVADFLRQLQGTGEPATLMSAPPRVPKIKNYETRPPSINRLTEDPTADKKRDEPSRRPRRDAR